MLTFNGATAFAGSSSLSATTLGRIYVAGAALLTADGNISLDGTGPAGGDGQVGITLYLAASITSTGSGAISLVGHGNGNGIHEDGVYLIDGSRVISAGHRGDNTRATSPSTSSTDTFAVFLTGTGTLVSSASGDIAISGTAAGAVGGVNNAGVLLQYSALVQATGSAKVSNHRDWLADRGVQQPGHRDPRVRGRDRVDARSPWSGRGARASPTASRSPATPSSIPPARLLITTAGTSVGSGKGVRPHQTVQVRPSGGSQPGGHRRIHRRRADGGVEVDPADRSSPPPARSS